MPDTDSSQTLLRTHFFGKQGRTRSGVGGREKLGGGLGPVDGVKLEGVPTTSGLRGCSLDTVGLAH